MSPASTAPHNASVTGLLQAAELITEVDSAYATREWQKCIDVSEEAETQPTSPSFFLRLAVAFWQCEQPFRAVSSTLLM